MVVCGKANRRTGDSLTGYINVYDRQWKLIIDVTLPINTTGGDTWVDVAADKDGMTIAAEACQSKIYVINPADGKIVNTITCKDNIRLCDMLSSGHIIARLYPADRRVLIIDREGVQREITHSDVIWNVCVDPKTDDLYVVTSDEEYKTCVIDQVMSEGDMKKRRAVSFPLSASLVLTSFSKKEQESYAGAGSVAEEVLSCIRTVVAFGGEQKEVARYEKELHTARDLGVKKGVTTGVGMGVTMLILYGSYGLAFW
eukprot:XP_011669731.1 PREDICTED: uncharacterized protein LOC105440859 [Strongylocentrotus purpuratus]